MNELHYFACGGMEFGLAFRMKWGYHFRINLGLVTLTPVRSKRWMLQIPQWV